METKNGFQAARKIDGLIGQRIKHFRKARNMSQTDLGKAIGVTYPQVQKIENGTNRASGGRLAIIAKHLEIDIMDLYEGTF